MGNKLAAAVGDTCICFHKNRGSVNRIAQGLGRDLDEAVLASTGEFIDSNSS
tara:strand:- start:304 stop:459 length:156 start_codon:yes stop_codon:yes gene_type:complete